MRAHDLSLTDGDAAGPRERGKDRLAVVFEGSKFNTGGNRTVTGHASREWTWAT